MDDDIGHVHITVTGKGHVPLNSRLGLINLTPAGTAIVIGLPAVLFLLGHSCPW